MAKTKAAKKTLFVIREGTGRLSRAVSDQVTMHSPVQVKRLRDAAMRGMVDKEWGWEIGRLFLERKITADEYEAGKRWRGLVEAWRKYEGTPGAHPKAISLLSSGRSPLSDPDSEAGQNEAKKAQELRLEVASAHATLVAFGMLTEHAVRRTCEHDEAPIGEEGLNRLTQGLSALSSLWGLTQGSKNGRSSV